VAGVSAFRITVALFVATLALPASALAVTCAPPGNSGIDQYFETIPGASCNQAPPGSGPAGSPGAVQLTPGQRRQLASLGPAGRAVAQFVAATAPAIEGTGPRSSEGTGPPSPQTGGKRAAPILIAAAPPATTGESPIMGMLKPIVSGSAPGGVGILLPIFLAAALLLAVVTVLRRLWTRP
jgi:hypothetical protein